MQNCLLAALFWILNTLSLQTLLMTLTSTFFKGAHFHPKVKHIVIGMLQRSSPIQHADCTWSYLQIWRGQVWKRTYRMPRKEPSETTLHVNFINLTKKLPSWQISTNPNHWYIWIFLLASVGINFVRGACTQIFFVNHCLLVVENAK